MLKWNIEWVDLKNIERMIAECWRLNERQMYRYYQDLEEQRELVFAGRLGEVFLEMMGDILTGMADASWPELQKDVHMIQRLIQDGKNRDETGWIKQYQEIIDEPEFYFYTKLGRAFTDILAERLELDLDPDKRMLQKDLRQIQRVCEACDFNSQEEVQKMVEVLQRKQVFSSWLGEGFLNQLQARLGRSIEEELGIEELGIEELGLAAGTGGAEIDPNILAETDFDIDLESPSKPKKKRRFKASKWMICLAFAGILAVSAGVWAHAQAERGYHLMGLSDTPERENAAAGRENSSAAVEPADETNEDTGNENRKLEEKTVIESEAPEISQEETEATETASDARTASDDEALQEGARNETDDGENVDDGQADAGKTVLPQYQELAREYPDVFGWLKIPGTSIDVPVMQSVDRRYFYLHHDYTGQPSEEGSVFVEADSSCYPQDDNTVLYGHNMANGHIFGTLIRYEDPQYFKEHQSIQYDTIYETGEYEVVAVVRTRVLYQDEPGFRYYRFYNYGNEAEFAECSDFIRRNRLYDTGKEIKYGDKIIMLSTCDYSQVNGRLAVVARRVGDGKTA